MRRGFTGRCFTCGGRGHKAHECTSYQFGQTNLAGWQDAGHEEQGGMGMTIYSIPSDQEIGGLLGEILNPPPAFGNDQQQQQAAPRALCEIPEGVNVERGYAVAHDPTVDDLRRLREEFIRRTGIENPALVMVSDSHPAGAQHPHAQPARARGQAGRGSLPGARDAEPNPAGSGLPGNYRVRRAYGSRGQGHQRRQRRESDWHMRAQGVDNDNDEEEIMDGPGSGYIQGQENMGTGGGQASMAEQQGDVGDHATRSGGVGLGERPRGSPMNQAAREYEMAPGEILGFKLTRDDAHALVDRMANAHPQGRLNLRVTTVSVDDRAVPTISTAPSGRHLVSRDTRREDGPVSSEEVRDRFLSALNPPGDPFAFNATLNRRDRRAPTDAADQPAYETSEDQIREEAGDDMDYEQEDK